MIASKHRVKQTYNVIVNKIVEIVQVFWPDNLWNEIHDTRNGFRITFTWQDGRLSGKQTVLKRSSNSNNWLMDGADGSATRSVEPSFSSGVDFIVIGYPRTTTRSYYIFEDGTGYFCEPDGTNRENFTWFSRVG